MNDPHSRPTLVSPADLNAWNESIKRARDAHLNQTTCHRCGTLLDLDPGRVDRVCEGCKETQ